MNRLIGFFLTLLVIASASPANLGPFPVGQVSDAIYNPGRNGGTTQTSWTLPQEYYTYQGVPFSPTMNGTGRAWTMTVFYPAAPVNSSTPLASPRDYPASVWQAAGQLVGYAGVPVANGEFPLEVFSPGYGSDSVAYATTSGYYLASYGFIVVMIDFVPGDADFINETGNPAVVNVDNGSMLALVERAIDISQTITHFLNRSSTVGDLFYHHINEQQIIAAGHSYGGAAAEGLAFGPTNIRGTGYSIPKDNRVTALNLQDPSDWQYNFDQLVNNQLPMLVMNSQQSGGICGMRSFYADLSFPSARVKLNNSLHATFENDLCGFLPVFGIPSSYYPNCDSSLGFMTPNVSSPLIRGYAVSFLLSYIGNCQYGLYLLPDCAQYIENGNYEVWVLKFGNLIWNSTASAIANTADGQDLLLEQYPSAYVTDGCFTYFQDQVDVFDFNCGLAPLV